MDIEEGFKVFTMISQTPLLSIIIVNYNTKELTYNCIFSVKEKTQDLKYEIIVVDNNSNDNSVIFLREHFPDIIILESTKNLGFGCANNLATDIAKAEILLFLNSDTIIIDNSIKILYDYLIHHIDTGVCGGLLLNANGNIGSSSSSQLSLSYYLRGYIPFLRKAPIERNVSTATDVDIIIGADMMVKKEVFEKAGRFDPDFFLYCEESELSYRIKKLGYQIKLIPSARIIHLEGVSGKNHSEFIAQEIWYSRFLYFHKVYNKRYPYYLFMLWLTLYGISTIKGIFNSHRKKVLWNRVKVLNKSFRRYRKFAKQ